MTATAATQVQDDLAALWCERCCCSVASVSLWAPCSSVGGWVSGLQVGPHTGGPPPVGFLGLSGCVRCGERNASGLQDVKFTVLLLFARSLSAQQTRRISTHSSLSWAINTRTCLPKLQSRIDWSFSFLLCFSKPACNAHAATLQQMLCALRVPKQFLGISDTNYLKSLTVCCCLHRL